MLADALWQTVYMVGLSVTISSLWGIPLGIILVITDTGSIAENMPLNRILAFVVNTTRSIPFVILMVVIIPFTRFVTGSAIGTTAAVVPLSVAAIPFVARVVETSVREVDKGVIEAAQAMGAAPLQIIVKVLVPEALPAIISGITLTAVNLIGYSAMAGAIGGGGLGHLAIRYGYQGFDMKILLIIVVILIVFVQGTQFVGDRIAKKVIH
ncbi:MAG: ABC transporter permease [Firmicutes bacterium]|nr:ABC transporter permease [Bacillota bacterium]MDD3851650.1 ABC transporter permease [Bacillota bacterium]MDD4708400.1 ABC transporter permease [Bacillota bacterium]